MSQAQMIEEPQETHFICGNALTSPGGGYCKNRSCGRPSANLLDGECMTCAAKRGLSPLRAIGCWPIKLTDSAASNTTK